MFQPGLLAGRRILITGGGSGLGAAMAERFGELGASLLLCGRRAAVLDATAARLRGAGAQVDTAICDVRDAAAVEAMVDAAWARAPIDVLVNNAAASFIARTETLSARAADAILAPTLHGAMYGTLALGKRWIASGRPGVVLSILSTSTLTGRAYTVPSAMAKSGLLAMTRSLAVEWGPHGIRLVAIAPGPFPTEGSNRQLNPGERGASQARAPLNPSGRVGRPDELADLAAYLVSPQAGYINGEMVTIDGGAHLRTSGAEDLLQWSPAQWAALQAGRGR
ncbi:MAG TPA: SDR family oxidoreductase [Aquabacterium sp.]|nr:SDR family oxidoreductase [Aquabacterium sp.]HQC94137.1 SDR family oxidoreductase [Aquabacterium sp.]